VWESPDIIMDDTEQIYNEYYRAPNYFNDRRWLYSPFVSALVRKAGLCVGSRLLDAGCGQGFFTALFAERGISCVGIDLSTVAIEAARRSYARLPVRFEAGDILSIPCTRGFDAVFVRSCSLYNTDRFPTDVAVTDRLLEFLRPGGILIFDYYSRLASSARAENWRYHSLAQVEEHFAKYIDAEIYFSLRVESILLGGRTFSAANSRLAALVSRTTNVGGEIVAFVRR